MTLPLMQIPASSFTSFLGMPTEADPMRLDADFAVLGVPFGVPYEIRHVAYGASEAPAAIRERSARFGRMLDHYDFDLGGALFGGRDARIVDCGDVPADARDLEGNAKRATAAVRHILERGAVPIVLGGDDSVSALAIAAYEAHGPITVLQIDAHIDFRDEVNGFRHGYSSPMRRASEMAWVKRIVHVGARGIGSARPKDVADTLAAGNAIVTAREVRQRGAEAALSQIEPGGRYYIVLDCDGLDPSVMPGTSAPMPGGLAFYEAVDIFRGLAERGQVVGINVAEHYPSLDVNKITSLAITRLLVNLMDAIAKTRG